jgi:hypothetical protein
MLELPKRDFHIAPAVRQHVPLWIGLYGPSGGGKTYTAERLAKGIQEVQGGPIYGVDTEAGRMLHYADQFEFMHIPFGEPYGSLDYLAVIRAALKHNTTGKRPTVIIDSMSHEHEGPGGMLDTHDKKATSMATYNGEFDAKKYERVKMLAWADPKAKRRALINGMLNAEANFILCFRAKESSVPVQVKVEAEGNRRAFTKTEVVNQGFVPIGGDDFIYECTLAALLMPGAKGVPTWHSQLIGEAKMIKLPEQFKSLPELGEKPLDEGVGRLLATWADGANAARTGDTATLSQLPRDNAAAHLANEQRAAGTGKPSAEQRARDWVDWFKNELLTLDTNGAVTAFEAEHEKALAKLETSLPALHKEAKDAAMARHAAIDMGAD